MSKIWSKVFQWLYIIPALLHAFGFFILYRFRQNYKNKIQWCYLLNLSFVEMLYCLGVCSKSFFTNTHLYYQLAVDAGIFTWYLSIMVLLTVDRLLEICLNIKYHLYCSVLKTKLILCGTVLFSVGITCSFLLLFKHEDSKLFLTCYNYLIVVQDGIFLITATVTYGYILTKIWKQRKKAKAFRTSIISNNNCLHLTLSTSSSTTTTQKRNVSKKTMQSLNYITIPFLLVATYFLFWFIPDTIILVLVRLMGIFAPNEMITVFYVLYLLALISDALIYTLFSKQTRILLARKLYTKIVKRHRHGNISDNNDLLTFS